MRSTYGGEAPPAVSKKRGRRLLRAGAHDAAPWHFLNFLPLPQGQGSLRPTPAYGFATAASTGVGRPDGGNGPVEVPPLTSPSASGFIATMGGGRRGLGPPRSPEPGPPA